MKLKVIFTGLFVTLTSAVGLADLNLNKAQFCNLEAQVMGENAMKPNNDEVEMNGSEIPTNEALIRKNLSVTGGSYQVAIRSLTKSSSVVSPNKLQVTVYFFDSNGSEPILISNTASIINEGGGDVRNSLFISEYNKTSSGNEISLRVSCMEQFQDEGIGGIFQRTLEKYTPRIMEGS